MNRRPAYESISTTSPAPSGAGERHPQVVFAPRPVVEPQLVAAAPAAGQPAARRRGGVDPPRAADAVPPRVDPGQRVDRRRRSARAVVGLCTAGGDATPLMSGGLRPSPEPGPSHRHLRQWRRPSTTGIFFVVHVLAQLRIASEG